MVRMFQQCPACGGRLVFTECRCAECHLELRGEFALGLFANLSDDQLTFTRVFLRARGNLSEVEKILGISYPTIRNKLDEINRALERAEGAVTPESAPDKADQRPTGPGEEARRAVLQQVATGQVTAAEALEKLRALQGGE